MELDGKEIADSTIDGVDSRDYPDFCDAYISSATFEDGTTLTDEELERLNELYPEIVSEMAFQSCIG